MKWTRGLPFAPDRAWLMAFAALAAVNGPFENLALLHIIQGDFPPGRIAQVYRVQMCAVFAGLLVGYLAAPSLFGVLGLGTTIALVGAITLATGLIGLAWHGCSRVGSKPIPRLSDLAHDVAPDQRSVRYR